MSRHEPDQSALAKAEVLTEALPYMQRYAGATFVVKYGGHAMGDPAAARDFADDVVLLCVGELGKDRQRDDLPRAGLGMREFARSVIQVGVRRLEM